MRHIGAFGVAFLFWQSACAGDDPPPPNCGTDGREAATGFTFNVIRPLAKHIATGKPVSFVSGVTAQREFVLGGSAAEVGDFDEDPISWTPHTGTVSLGRPPGVSAAARFNLGDVNARGSVAVGAWWESTGYSYAYRWTATASFEEITPPWPSAGFLDMSLSGDGSVAVIEAYDPGPTRTFGWDAGQLYDIGLPGSGRSEIVYVRPDEPDMLGNASTPWRAVFRWTAEGGVVDLGAPEGYNQVWFRVASMGPDGLVAGGDCWNAATRHPCLWSEKIGWRVLTEIPPDGGIEDLSPDGSVAVAISVLPPDVQGLQGLQVWIWTADAGLRIIELPDGLRVYGGLHVSDGGVVVGTGEFEGKSSVFRWAGESPAALLPPLPEHNSTDVYELSADGATALGWSWTYDPMASPEVDDTQWVLWDDFGVHRVADVVGAPGATTLLSASMLDRNADVLFGDATVASYCDHGGPRGWVARRMR